jgi:hypothetical protein
MPRPSPADKRNFKGLNGNGTVFVSGIILARELFVFDKAP